MASRKVTTKKAKASEASVVISEETKEVVQSTHLTVDRSTVRIGGFKVTRPLSSSPTKLLTIRGAEEMMGIVIGGGPNRIKGAIVRLVQAPTDTPEHVERARQALVEAGAATVRVIGVPKSAVVVNKPGGEEREAAPRQTSAREIVATLIAEARTQDRDALKAHAEEIMGRASL